MTIRALLLTAVFTASSSAAPVPKELKQPDHARFQGLWTFATYDHGGREVGGGRWLFEKSHLFAGGRNTTDDKGTDFRFVLRSTRFRSEIDIYYGRNVRCKGIYEFVGEDLRVAYYHGTERPADFASAEGKDVFLLKHSSRAKK